MLEIAIQTALAKRGVTVVAIPLRKTTYREPSAVVKPANPVLSPSPDEIGRLAEMLNHGKAVTILGGGGCAEAHEELMAVAGKLQPCAAGNTSSSTIPYDVGLHGLIGFSSGYHAIKEIPRRVEFSDTELPKSGSGKILKRILRERSWAHQERAVD